MQIALRVVCSECAAVRRDAAARFVVPRARSCCAARVAVGSCRAACSFPGGRFAVVAIDLQSKLISCDHHSTTACAEALGSFACGVNNLSRSPRCLTARKGPPPDGAVVPRSGPNGALRAKGPSGAPITFGSHYGSFLQK